MARNGVTTNLVGSLMFGRDECVDYRGRPDIMRITRKGVRVRAVWRAETDTYALVEIEDTGEMIDNVPITLLSSKIGGGK